MVEFAERPEGPGQVVVRGESPPRSEGALHPFSPRIWSRNEQARMAEAQANRDALGFGEGVFGGPVAPNPRYPNRMMGPPLEQGGLDGILTQIFDRLSRQVAGGLRQDHRSFLPETDLPDEGTIPEEFLPDVQTVDWFDPTVWARATPENISQVDLSKIAPATGPGKDGKGKDWFRGGEAPNNLQNRSNPLYQARRDFAVKIAPEIEAMFGVSAQGSAGYLRPYSPSHAEPGGPSANSDHYSGGAIDFFGDKTELDELRDWLVTQPFSSFVRWQSESHFDHVHVSFDVGWVAQNYFEGQQVPPVVQKPVSAPTSTRRSSSQVAADPRTRVV